MSIKVDNEGFVSGSLFGTKASLLVWLLRQLHDTRVHGFVKSLLQLGVDNARVGAADTKSTTLIRLLPREAP